MAGFDDFDAALANDLMASLEAHQSTGDMFPALTLDDIVLERTIENLGVQVSSPRGTKKPSLERVTSRTGRPEDVYQTVKRKTHKGVNLQVGNYQLGEKLGKGAFGVVYKGLDMKTGQFVAVKRISKEFVNGDAMMQEIDFLKKFQHKNIVRYITLVQTERHLNLVLEFVDSGSLAQVLCGYGFFPESLAAIYINQVLDGLSYLHSQQVIHRDIKGGNLLITRDGAIKVADFGIATVVTSNPRYSTLAEGSPYWMAPEVIEMSQTTTASDIWSIGCTLIELLTGFPPYFDMTAVSAIYKMVNEGMPPLPEDISEELEDFLTQCFQREPDSRPTAQQLMNHPWIRLHVPEQSSSSSAAPLDVEQMRDTIKNYTLTKEAGLQIKEQLRMMEGDPDLHQSLSTMSPRSDHSSGSGSMGRKSKGGTSKSKKDKKRSSSRDDVDIDSDDFSDISDASASLRKKAKSGKRGKKSTLGKFRKNKSKKGDSEGQIAASDANLMVVNIYAVENRRQFFTYTVYKIKVMQDARMWDIERTWSDFKELHFQLEQSFGEDEIPPCPSRRFWGVMDSDFIRKRWQELQHFLLALVSSKAIRDSEPFLRFLTAQE